MTQRHEIELENGMDDRMGSYMPADAGAGISADMAIDLKGLNAQDIIALTARLAQVLAEEADFLEAMKLSKVSELQREKKVLTDALDAVKKQVAKQPELLDEMTDQEREDLTQVVRIFNEVLEENYHRLSMARAVNQNLVKAITELVNEQARSDNYNKKGKNGKLAIDRVSVTLDEKV